MLNLMRTQEAVHWPLDFTLSPAALAEVECAVRTYLDDTGRGALKRGKVHNELVNLANAIRSLLQHMAREATEREPTDEELLS